MKFIRFRPIKDVDEYLKNQRRDDARIGKPLPTRDVRTLIVAQAVLEKAQQAQAENDPVIDARRREAVPAEVEAWARTALGEEVCTCSI